MIDLEHGERHPDFPSLATAPGGRVYAAWQADGEAGSRQVYLAEVTQ